MLRVFWFAVSSFAKDTNVLKNKITAGVVQFDIKKGQIENNLDAVFEALDTLAMHQVSLAVLPEMFSCSFDNENLKQHCLETDKTVERLCCFSQKHKMAIAGSLPFKKGNRIFNTSVFIDTDGSLKSKYGKIHLFRLTREDKFYKAGDQVRVVDSSLGRIGFMICYDLRFPELARSLFLQGAQIIVVSAQWPESRQMHWEILTRARAVENQLFMVCSNRTGKEGDLEFSGGSIVLDPFGTVLVKAGEKENTAFAELDFEKINQARAQIPCMSDRRQEIYGK